MPTIAEIIAAKQAKAAQKPAPAAAPVKKESIAEKVELEAAIDRIDPPGKSKARGLVLSKALPAGENRGQATEIRGPSEMEERSLAGPAGEQFPMVPPDADAETTAWHRALQSFETELCAMRDPRDPEAVWLALRHADKRELPPLLLHRLPVLLWEAPTAPDPEGDPY